jgi:hypothetical protein
MEFLKTLTLGMQRNRVSDRAGLVTEIGAGAAFLAQGSGFSYIRARSGTMGPRLMQDAGFGRGMERCKWEGFAAAAGDLILIVEGGLRPRAATGPGFWQALYRDVLAAHPVPEHRPDWSDRIAGFEGRLAAHLAAPPRGIEDICHHSAEVILEFAPVEDRIRALDHEMVTNNVKFRFIEHVDGLRKRLDWAALAEIATAGAPQG